MATIVDGKKRISYMRGMLVHYLIERGFNHEDACTVAEGVRAALSKRKDVSRKEMVRLVEEHIRRKHGEAPVGDLVFWERLPTSVTVERRDSARPFSKELLSHSIQASGLEPDQAYQIARDIEAMLIDGRRSRIAHTELEDLTEVVIAERHGPECAERYRVWRTRGDLDKPLIILVGGATGVGKTSLAISLAHVLDIPRVVATDDIRQIMRLMLAPELVPAIHTSSYMVWSETEAPDVQGRDPVIAGFREQAKVVSVGVQAILSRCIEEKSSVIIDGVHLLPDFVNLSLYCKAAFVVQLGLVLSDRGIYEQRFAKREAESPSRPMHRYLSHLDEILKIQDHIVACNARRDIPLIDSGAVDNVTSAAVMVVVETLQEHGDISEALEKERPKKRKKRS